MFDLVYYSSESGNTVRFVSKLSIDSQIYRITDKELIADKPFVLICPTYADGKGVGAVPKEVIRFLNNEQNRKHLKGIIGSGNKNFGSMYALGANIIAKKCNVPILYKFELSGNDKDVAIVNVGLKKFWDKENDQ